MNSRINNLKTIHFLLENELKNWLKIQMDLKRKWQEEEEKKVLLIHYLKDYRDKLPKTTDLICAFNYQQYQAFLAQLAKAVDEQHKKVHFTKKKYEDFSEKFDKKERKRKKIIELIEGLEKGMKKARQKREEVQNTCFFNQLNSESLKQKDIGTE